MERRDLDEVISGLSVEVGDPAVCLGCPHCSLREVEEVARMLEGRRLSRRLWVFTSRGVYTEAERLG
ncbi:MAG: hypothetical protein DRG31_02770, partial [Deltaproteobacteria bacterium]